MKQGGISQMAHEIQPKGKKAEYLQHQAECAKEIDDAHTTINNNQQEYDKQLLVLSSGFLAVSLAFIKDVVPLARALHLWLLYSSFIVLVMCVLLVLFSYQLSNAGHTKVKKYWQALKAGDKKVEYPHGYAKWVTNVNIASGVVFLLGITLTIIFVSLNIHHEANMKQVSEAQGVNLPRCDRQ